MTLQGSSNRKCRRRLAPFALAACFVLLPPAAQAAEDYFDLSPEQLVKATVYSASRKSESLSKTPAAVFVITQEDIRRSGATNIPDLLRMVPGVNVAQTDSNTWAVSIRGFQNNSANKILVMIDGRTVYNPLISGTYWEVQDLPLVDINRIEVIRGPGGTLWGANAVNGVINILTKSAKDTQGNLVNLRMGNYENGAVAARHGGALGEGWYRVYAKYFSRDSFRTFSGNDAPDEWESYRTGFRMDWGDTESPDRMILHGDLYRVDSSELDTSYSLTAPYSMTQEEDVKSRGGNIFGLWRHTYDDGASLRIQSYLDYSKRDQVLLQDDRWIFDIESQYNFQPFGRHEVIVGGNYRVVADELGGSDRVAFSPDRRTDSIGSVFIQDKITLMPEQWFLILGSKIENNHYTNVEVQPNARLMWTPDETQTIWASVSRAIRTPSRIERDLDITNLIVPPGAVFPGFPTELILARNDDFDSEELTAYELGYRNQLTPDFTIDTSAFVNVYDRLISAIVLPENFVPAGVDPAHFELPIQAVNEMTGNVYGVELTASWNVQPDLKLSAGYTFLNMDLHAPQALGATQDTVEDRSPQQQFNIRSYWNIDDRWTLDALAYYVDELSQDNVPSYTRLDLNIGYKINDKLHFNLVGQNLLDDAHHEFGDISDANTAQAVRSIFGKLTWEF